MNELINEWRGYLETERDLAPSTVHLYTRYLESLANEIGEPSTLQTKDLRAWLHNKRGSAATVGNRIAALRSFYQFLLRRGARPDNPSSELVAPKRRAKPPEPVEDLEDVLQRLDDLDRKANLAGVIPRRVGETRDMAIFLAETGLRIGDAVACEWPLPCPPEVAIKVGRRKEKLIVSDAAREAWERLNGRWPLGTRATQRRFEKAGFHPHQLRHWHKAFKRPIPPSAAGGAQSLRVGNASSAFEEIVSFYSDAEREVIVDFLTKAMKALQTEAELNGE